MHRIAVDASAKPVRIWLPQRLRQPEPAALLRGRPATSSWTRATRGRPGRCGREGPRDLTVDRVRGEVYVKANGNKTYRLDDETGEVKGVIDVAQVSPGTVLASQLVPGQDGDLYVFTWNKGLWRLDRDGKPKNWDGLNTHSIPIEGMMCFQMRHLALQALRPDRRGLRHRHGRLPDEEPEGRRQVPDAQRRSARTARRSAR